jgi:hypothetical protein
VLAGEEDVGRFGITDLARETNGRAGYSDQRTSDTPNFADSAAMRISVPCRISVPPAMATPSTAAMIGFVGRYVLVRPS